MKLENVKVGETYTLKVGKNLVAVTVKGVDAKGKITVASAGGKQMTVADAARLGAKQAAHGATGKVTASKGAKAAAKRSTAHQGTLQAKEKRVGLADAAILVLHEGGNTPMNVKDLVEAILAKKLWSTTGKTPAATLYSCILREIQKKGSAARFKKVDRGQFALNG